MKQTLLFILFSAVAISGADVGWWEPVDALFAIVIQCGIDDICTAIKTRTITVNVSGPIRFKHIYDEED